MQDVDLSTFVFDYDLTLAFVMMNADGTVYHRYGSRSFQDPMDRQSMASLVAAIQAAKQTHARYSRNPSPPTLPPPRTVFDIQPWAKRAIAAKTDCVHCHMVHEAIREEAQARKTWKPDDIWIYPLPEQAGLTLNRDDHSLVDGIASGSPAAEAGLQRGDRLRSIAGAPVATQADVQWHLHNLPFAGGALEIGYERGGETKTASLKFAPGWKVQDPLDYSWRPYKWRLRPNPGFGGPDLRPEEKKKLGLDEKAFAMKVNYIIDWGEDADTGEHAKKAGIRKGDVLLSANGKSDFRGGEHFQTWFRLAVKAGTMVELVVLRNGTAITLGLEAKP
jgi:hypothetical protein